MAKEEDKTDSLLDDAKKDTSNIEALVETMRAANAMTSNIARDQAATRDRLMEVKQLLSGESLFNEGYGDKFSAFDDQEQSWHWKSWFDRRKDKKNLKKKEQQEAEDKEEQKNVFVKILDALKQQSTWQDPKNSKKIASGFMGKFSKILTGAGIGVGVAGMGIAAVMASGAYFIKTMEEIDGKKIKENVVELLSISDAFGGEDGEGKFKKMFKEGGSFYVMMAGLGAGLLVFSAGAGLAAWVAKDQDPKWTENIKKSVISLLSISKELTAEGEETLMKGGPFFKTMAGVGFGLAAFGIGQTIGGVGHAISEFVNKDGWAETVKQNVKTLLSITDEIPKDIGFFGTGFAGIMTELATGLAVFGLGKVVSGLGSALNLFKTNFAEGIKDEVITLLSIGQLPEAQDTAIMDKFGFTMLGLAGGLAVFGLGKVVHGLGSALNLYKDNFALGVKEEVITLLSIGEEEFHLENMAKFVSTMTFLAAGLAVFGAGKGIGAIGSALEGIVGWFTGEKSPVEQALALADRAEELERGVDAFDRFGDVLVKFAGIGKISEDWELEQMADDLLTASEIINIAIAGGTTGLNSLKRNRDYVGIANIEGMKEALENVALLKSAFTFEVPSTGIAMSAAALANVEGQGGGTAIVTTDNSDSSTSVASATIISTPMIDKTTLGLQASGGGPGQ